MESLKLSNFISLTLTEIAQGVKQSNDLLKRVAKGQNEVYLLRGNRGDNSKIPGISFDVAVTANATQKDSAGFIVALASIGGGAKVEKGRGDESVHRIRFEIGIEHDYR